MLSQSRILYNSVFLIHKMLSSHLHKCVHAREKRQKRRFSLRCVGLNPCLIIILLRILLNKDKDAVSIIISMGGTDEKLSETQNIR